MKNITAIADIQKANEYAEKAKEIDDIDHLHLLLEMIQTNNNLAILQLKDLEKRINDIL